METNHSSALCFESQNLQFNCSCKNLLQSGWLFVSVRVYSVMSEIHRVAIRDGGNQGLRQYMRE